MLSRKGLALVTACAALACGGLVRADGLPASAISFDTSAFPMMLDNAPPTSAPLATMPTTPEAPPAAASSTTPAGGALMVLLGRGDHTLRLGDALDNAGIVISGYVEGSWTYSAHVPEGNILSDRAFDTKTESIQLDQVELLIQKQLSWDPKALTYGFTVEGIYGFDAAYFHSNGLTVYSPGKTASPVPFGGSTATIHPKAQLDLTQAYFEIGLPIGYGVGFEGGKFDTLLGYEVIDSPSNPFFSHSYIFTQEPFTHTGALGIWNITDSTSADVLTLTGGITRGWDQATDDNNGSIDYTGQLLYKKVDTKAPSNTPPLYSIQLEGITGDEQPSPAFGTVGQDGWRTVLDMIGTYTFSDQLSFAVNGMYAWQAQAANGGFGGGNGQWYGAAVYAKYSPPQISNYVTLNIRAEWFDDQDGAAPTQYSTSVFTTHVPNQYYEATIGLTIKPLPNNAYLSGLAIRPELRWDYSDKAAFNGGSEHDQWTAAVEAYFAF